MQLICNASDFDVIHRHYRCRGGWRYCIDTVDEIQFQVELSEKRQRERELAWQRNG
ncbi:hypothetical protein [Roseiconus lacunae]|uniref:hypothetical protein n=1 Tax=Roseiconus lacunae TaxID=2605694 RepID=UPI00135C0619|nr:hypothetical protein [Roseiconus lacunae]